MPGIQPRRPKATLAPVVHGFPPLESEFEQEEYILPALVSEILLVHSRSVASERVVIGAIQCLTESKDMELSYVSPLSAITVLDSRDWEGERAVAEVKEKGMVLLGIEDSVGKQYAELLGIMTRAEVAEGLEKETLRQGNDDHVRLGQFLFDRQNTEDALYCLTKVESTRWTSPVYRLAISCLPYSKPRHLHEAEILLDQCLDHNKAQSSAFPSSSTFFSSTRPRRGSGSSRDQDREQFNKSLIQTWFKQQLGASKWDETKAQYECRRARLLDAPSSIERFSASMLVNNNDYLSSAGGGGGGVFGHKRGGSSVSRASNVAEHGSVASESSETLTAGGTGIASIPAAAVVLEIPVAPLKRSSFSLFSAFRSSKASPPIAPPAVPTIQTRPVHDMQRQQQPPSSASAVQVNRHLTILDNGILEECVNHNQFEYGWTIYERMGPSLEDKDTSKIAMRLCKRAFLGHGGLRPNLPRSLLAKDVYFEDEMVASQAGASGRDPELRCYRERGKWRNLDESGVENGGHNCSFSIPAQHPDGRHQLSRAVVTIS
ncbi:hypothetical protein BGW39_003243 [Mortierella sp. 14UC]|nr:hypothetical protein BGW39_003243 [Mortierella sp. 14UC]